MIVALERLGFAVRDVDQTRRVFRDLFGLESQAACADPLIGVRKAADIPFANGCCLYLMESSDPGSDVYRYLQDKGPGLERLILRTDDIEEDGERLLLAGARSIGEPVHETQGCRRLILPAADGLGFAAVELVQPCNGVGRLLPGSDSSGVFGLQHIGAAVRDLQEAGVAFKRLFDLEMHSLRTDQHGGEQRDAMIEPGNDRLWLHLTESWGPTARVCQFVEARGPGLEHICIEVADIRQAVRRVTGRGVPVFDNRIFTDREDGFEAFVYPEHSTGVTVELIEPYPTSRGYREKR